MYQDGMPSSIWVRSPRVWSWRTLRASKANLALMVPCSCLPRLWLCTDSRLEVQNNIESGIVWAYLGLCQLLTLKDFYSRNPVSTLKLRHDQLPWTLVARRLDQSWPIASRFSGVSFHTSVVAQWAEGMKAPLIKKRLREASACRTLPQ